ncbi:hypothetical protein Trydic_g11281 [Trypoxylus dichotomus]
MITKAEGGIIDTKRSVKTAKEVTNLSNKPLYQDAVIVFCKGMKLFLVSTTVSAIESWNLRTNPAVDVKTYNN